MKFEYAISRMNFTSAGEASSHIKKTLKQLGIDSAIIRRAAIAAYESEINIAIHSNGGFIHVQIDQNRFELIAEDTGPGIADIDKAMEEGFSTASHEVREMGFGAGMGLPNIKKCSDEFSIESEVGVYTRLKVIINF